MISLGATRRNFAIILLSTSIRRPNTFTGLAGLISSPWLAGVFPKKIQNAAPGGQYPRSPNSTIFLAFSSLTLTGTRK